MSSLNIYNITQDSLIAKNILVADSFWLKLKGLMGKATLPKETAMFFKGCPSVHTFFMRFPIDVVFLDKNMIVTAVVENLRPWRCTKPLQFKNYYCVEMYSNKISSKISKGDLLDVRT